MAININDYLLHLLILIFFSINIILFLLYFKSICIFIETYLTYIIN